MIVSFQHNYIFVKSRKTSGTSMEIALGSTAGPSDVVTPLADEDDLLRFSLFPDSMPRNYSDNPELEQRYWTAVRNNDTWAMKQVRKNQLLSHFKLYNHAAAKRARKFLDEAFWNRAYKFTIERHPYDKAVSMAWFRRGERPIDEVLESVVADGKYRNFELYSEKGKVIVDFIIRYEKMKEDIKAIEQKLGFEILARYPSAKSDYRPPERKPAMETLSDAQKKKIQSVCAEEFELMGYER